MAKCLTVALGAGLLTAIGPLGLSHPTSAGAAGLSAASSGTLVYQANSKKTFAKWTLPKLTGGGGFKVVGKTLTFDGSNDAGAFAPFKTKGLKNFAVQAQIKVGTSSKPASASYDIFVRRAVKNASSGIFAGYDAAGGEQNATNVADLYWHGAEDEYVPGTGLTPDTAYHTYRVEVRGTMYRFLADGQELVPWTLVKDNSTFNQIGLTFTYIPATVKSFKVFKLSGSAVSTQNDTSLLVTHSLITTDVTVSPFSGVFRDNNLYALDSGFTVSQLQSMGRIYGYLEQFSDAQTYVSESVNLHASSAGAQTIYAAFVKGIQDNSSQARNFKVVDVSTLGIGDEAFAFSYDYDFQGAPSYVTEVLFHRGDYYVAVLVDSADPNISKTSTTIAQTADKEVQTPHT